MGNSNKKGCIGELNLTFALFQKMQKQGVKMVDPEVNHGLSNFDKIEKSLFGNCKPDFSLLTTFSLLPESALQGNILPGVQGLLASF